MAAETKLKKKKNTNGVVYRKCTNMSRLDGKKRMHYYMRERVVVVVGKEAESNLLGRAYPLHHCRGVNNNNNKELYKGEKKPTARCCCVRRTRRTHFTLCCAIKACIVFFFPRSTCMNFEERRGVKTGSITHTHTMRCFHAQPYEERAARATVHCLFAPERESNSLFFFFSLLTCVASELRDER